MVDVTAVILSFNEAGNIRNCLESVADFCDILVVDSGSTDDTVGICREYTSKIFTHEYVSHAEQWNWAVGALPLETEWLLALDADFVVTDGLKRDLATELPKVGNDVDGIYVRHRYVFAGGQIRFGGTKQYWLRVARRRNLAVDTSDLVDFRFIVPGRTIRFRSAVIEYNRHDDDISTWLKKQDKFSIRLAVEEEARRRKQLDWGRKPHLFGNPDERITWLRDRWLSLPLFARPVLYFFYRYILMLGFLDGRAGFLYHFLQGWWLRTVVDWKIMSIRRLKMDAGDFSEFRRAVLGSTNGSVDYFSTRVRSGK